MKYNEACHNVFATYFLQEILLIMDCLNITLFWTLHTAGNGAHISSPSAPKKAYVKFQKTLTEAASARLDKS